MTTRRLGWGRLAIAAALITVGSILVPLAVVANWAEAEFSDTDAFVASFAPLADDPDVQAFVTEQVVVAIGQHVDIAELTSAAFDGVAGLGLGPVALRALEALKGPATLGIENLVRDTVSRFVTSQAFATTWQRALRTTHGQLVATMKNDPNALIGVDADGGIGIQLGPIVAQVKTLLVEQGLTFAQRIPAVEHTVVVAQSDALLSAQRVYGLTMALGIWLPWIALALLCAGVFVARRRALALIWASGGFALAMIVLAVAVSVLRSTFVEALTRSDMPASVAAHIYEQLVGFIPGVAVCGAVLAVVVGLVTWLVGPFRLPRRWRASAAAIVATLRASRPSDVQGPEPSADESLHS